MSFKGFSEYGIRQPVFEVILPISKVKLYLTKITVGDESALAKSLINEKDVFEYTISFLWDHIQDSEPKFKTMQEFMNNIADADINVIFWILYFISYVKEGKLPVIESIMCENGHLQEFEHIPVKYINPKTGKQETIYKEKVFDANQLEFKDKLIEKKLFDGQVKWYLGIPTLAKSLSVSKLYRKETEPLTEEIEILEAKTNEIDETIKSMKEKNQYNDQLFEKLNKEKISIVDRLMKLRSSIDYINSIYNEIITYTYKFSILEKKKEKTKVLNEDGKEEVKTIEKENELIFKETEDIINAYKELTKDDKEEILKEIKDNLSKYGVSFSYVYECPVCKKEKMENQHHIYDIDIQKYFFRFVPQLS